MKGDGYNSRGRKHSNDVHNILENLRFHVIECGEFASKHIQFPEEERESVIDEHIFFDSFENENAMDTRTNGVGTFLATATEKVDDLMIVPREK